MLPDHLIASYGFSPWIPFYEDTQSCWIWGSGNQTDSGSPTLSSRENVQQKFCRKHPHTGVGKLNFSIMVERTEKDVDKGKRICSGMFAVNHSGSSYMSFYNPIRCSFLFFNLRNFAESWSNSSQIQSMFLHSFLS